METIRTTIQKSYRNLDGVFTPREAWGLFRFASYAETVGWCLLITGITSKITHAPLNDWIMPIAGTIHGVFFIGYILLVFFAHRSMKWSITQLIAALVLCNIPFGALVFERYMTKRLRPQDV